MELTDLGYDAWLRGKRDELQKPELAAARITRVDRDRFLVRNEQDEVQAQPTGRLIYSTGSSQDLPCVGDWVLVEYHNDGELAIIHDVLPRKTFLRRKAAGKKIDYQMIASNIDAACIMQSCDENFNLRRMERYLVAANDGHIAPIILLSKSDLVSPGDVACRRSEIAEARIDARVIAFSNETGQGMEEIRQTFEKGKTYCLLGSSGVGKTTLLNHLIGHEEFATREVRDQDGRGRHTTTRRQLTVLESGALLIDTPGMRELGMLAVASGIDDSFIDIHDLAEGCRFTDCTHTTETGCAILAAIEKKTLDADRFRSYVKLTKESAFHEMSYVERRRKDKEFGHMINSVKKTLNQRKPSAH